MRKPLMGISALALLAVGMLFGCGGGSGTTNNPPPGSGSLVVFGQDAPLCSVVAFDVTLTGATLTPARGGTPVSILSSADAVRVDFASLLGFATVLNFADVPAGTYSQINLALSDPELTVVDGTPPTPTAISTSLTRMTVPVAINPPLVVPENGEAGLMLDFRLLRSVQVDGAGAVTGVVDPVFRATPTVISTLFGHGELDEFYGLVTSVSTTSTIPRFIGSFNLQTARGRTFAVQGTQQTEFEGLTGLSGLETGVFVEVHAFVSADHHIVARHVEVEDREDESEGRAAFVGLVIAVERDSGGNATGFTLFLRRAYPTIDSIPPRSRLRVNLATDTRFSIAALGFHRASQLFNPMTLGVGQHVVAHGHFTAGDPPTLDAAAVYLRRQVVVGNYQPPLLAVGSDGKTGGFSLVPCNPIFQAQPIKVLTFAGTSFEGVSDLNGLSSTDLYAAKGLLFYQQTPGAVNGVTWNPPPPVNVEAAGVVRKLE